MPAAPPFGHAQAHLQRHRLAADVPAGAAQPGAAHAGPSRAKPRTRFTSRTRWSRCRTRPRASSATTPTAERGRAEAVRRGVGTQGARREDRRPARSAHRQGRRPKSRSATRSSPPTSAGAIGDADCGRRDPLLHAEVLARQADRVRHRGGAQLRGRDRAVPPVRGRAREQHLPQAAGARGADGGRRARGARPRRRPTN